MAVIPEVLSPVSNIVDSIIPDRYQIKIQEILIRGGMYVKASEMITLAILTSMAVGFIAAGFSFLVGINPILAGIAGFFIPPLLMAGYIFLMMEKGLMQ